MSTIDVKVLKNMLLGGAANLKNHSAEINELNVFPVPDGDTGLNMCKTIDGGVAKIKNKFIIKEWQKLVIPLLLVFLVYH